MSTLVCCVLPKQFIPLGRLKVDMRLQIPMTYFSQFSFILPLSCLLCVSALCLGTLTLQTTQEKWLLLGTSWEMAGATSLVSS